MDDREYIEAAVAKYTASLMRAAFSVTRDRSEAEDAVQETFIKLYRLRPSFTDSGHEKAWLLRVVINDAHNRARRMRRSFSPVPEPQTDWDDEHRTVMEAVGSLDEKYRTIVHLHFYEGYTVRETAEILGISPSTAGTRLERAKQKLRKLLDTE